MSEAKQGKSTNRNSTIVLAAFFATILFQITAYKFIWNIEWISRLTNVTILTIASVYAFKTLSGIRFNHSVLSYYIIPGLLVYSGFLINLSISSVSNIKVINQIGLLIPWAVYLSVPGWVKERRIDAQLLWRYFGYFMLATVSISIVEYFALFSGVVDPRPIMTSGGPFSAGYFSMLYATETGELHYRFYASFMEPGTLAMFLLPAMAYAFFCRKYFSLLIYFIAMYLSDSIGGFIGVAMLIPLLLYVKLNTKPLYPILLSSIFIFIIAISFSDYFVERYKEKGNSTFVREENIANAITNLPSLFLEHPLGLPLTESTEQAQQNDAYYGSNFTPGQAFNLGGILSFFGYLAVLMVSLRYAVASLFRKNLSPEEQAAVVSVFCLLPFIFQRTVVWDCSIFALLFAPFVVNYLQGTSSRSRVVKSCQLTTIPIV